MSAGPGGYSHGVPAEALCLVELPDPRQDFRPHAPPLGLPIGIFGHREAVGAPPLGQLQRLLVAPLSEDGLRQGRARCSRDTRTLRSPRSARRPCAARARLLPGRRRAARCGLQSKVCERGRGRAPQPTVVPVRRTRARRVTPVVTQFGIDLGTLLGGVIIVENIFGLPASASWPSNRSRRSTYR